MDSVGDHELEERIRLPARGKRFRTSARRDRCSLYSKMRGKVVDRVQLRLDNSVWQLFRDNDNFQ